MNNNLNNDDGDRILILGHGTLSGVRLPHPNYADPPLQEGKDWRYYGINVEGREGFIFNLCMGFKN